MATKKPTKKNPPGKKPGSFLDTAATRAQATPLETIEEIKQQKRAVVKSHAAAEKAWLEKNVEGNGRLNGRPRLYVRPCWELDENERDRFYRVHGIIGMFDQIGHKVHPSDRDIVTNALAATVGFHELSKLIDSLEWDTSEDDLVSDLERIRVGFELGLQALDKTLGERGIVLDARSRGGKNKHSPEWHSECIRLAHSFLDTGTAKHELVGKTGGAGEVFSAAPAT